MTFDEIVTEVKDRLNLTSSDATTRIGRAVNVMYRRVTSGLGLQVARRITGVIGTTSIGVQKFTFTGIEKIERILDTRSGSTKEIDERTFEEIRVINPSSSDTPHMWAVEKMGPSSVTVRLDVLPQTAFQLLADGLETAATLSGSQVPNFNQDFHDVLVEGVIADELRKQEKPVLARIAQDTYDKRLSELRFFIVKSANANLKAGGAQKTTTLSGNGGGGGSAPSGGASYTQTGLITFDRDPSAPFAVVSGSAYVDNLIADDVYIDTTDRLLGRDTAGAGTSEEISLTGGLEFSGSQSIRIADLGVITAKINDLAVTTAKVAADAITYAKMQNVSAVSKVLGRGSAAGSGDVEELTIGGGMWMNGTTLDAVQYFYNTTTTGTVNNLANMDARRLILRCNNASLLTITGLIAQGIDGDVIDVISVGAGQVDFTHQDAGSNAQNRLINFATVGTTSLAAGSGSARFVYDAQVTGRWRMVAHEQGAWITPTFAAGDFTATGGGSWTVAAGDVTTFAYLLRGRTLTIDYYIVTGTVAATASSLDIKIPAGLTSKKTIRDFFLGNNAGAGLAMGLRGVAAAATKITHNSNIGGSGWSAATDTTEVDGTITFEVQ